MANTAPQPLTPEQQRLVAEFRRKHPTFNVQSVDDVLNMRNDPQGVADYAALMNQLGNDTNDTWIIDPATGQWKQNESMKKWLARTIPKVAAIVTGAYAANNAFPQTAPNVPQGPNLPSDVQLDATQGPNLPPSGSTPTTPSLQKTIFKGLLEYGVPVATAVIGAKAASDAAQKQLDANAEALRVQKEIYEQNRKDLEPYRNLGYSSVSTLSDLMGFPKGGGSVGTPDVQPPVTLTPTTQTGTNGVSYRTAGGPIPGSEGVTRVGGPTPGPVTNPSTYRPPQTLSGLQPPGGAAPLASNPVTIRTPDGRIVRVPQAQVAEALRYGGQQVGA